MKTPDKIKLALNLCWKTRWEIGFAVCNDCPYISAVKPTCKEALERDVREYIYQLEAERDAAVADLKGYILKPRKVCSLCKNRNKPICNMCEGGDVFEWRGVQKEDGNA